MESLLAELESAKQENAALRASNQKLSELVARFQRMLFGHKNERYLDDNHPKLPFENQDSDLQPPPHVHEAPDEEYETVVRKKGKRRGQRISKDIPREEIQLELPTEDRLCPCCG